MYQVLLIDDETTSLQTVQWMLPWEKMGISRVLTADSALKAQELMKSFAVQIVICDIEMPRMNGIEFVEWMKRQYPDTEAIMLTCHSEFSFAQKALQLGSLDYILKPVQPEDLAAAVNKVIQTIESKNKIKEGYLHWKNMGKMRKEQFLINVIQHNVPSDEEALHAAMAKLSLEEDIHSKYKPILICKLRWREKFSEDDKALIEYSIRNMAQEIIVKSDTDGITYALADRQTLVLIQDNPETEHTISLLPNSCNELITTCNNYMNCDICCFIGSSSDITHLADRVEELINYQKAYVSSFNSTIFVGESSQSQKLENMPPQILENWKKHLENKRNPELIHAIQDYLVMLEKENALNAISLQMVQQNFIQMLYLYLQENNLKAQLLFQDKHSFQLMEQSLHSVHSFMEWLNWILKKTESFLEGVGQSNFIIKQVKDYVTLHINEDINREKIAEAVFINEDYLSRIFKQKTGITLSQYIVDKRIRLAKQLLSQTAIPVGDIALDLGYNSFSHFSKIFKENTGDTPAAFRKHAQGSAEMSE